MALQHVGARPNNTIIGGEDWSDFVTNFVPIRGGVEQDGITTITGTLEIAYHPDNPSSLDPLLNASLWKRSQTVRLEINNDSDTLVDHPFGFLFILRVPTLTPDGQLLSLEVGDYLALANTRDVPGDSSGVTLGTAVDLSVICQNYLESAGIPSGNISLGGPWGYSKALPIPKDNVNAVAMAGRIAYTADFRVLYQDTAGIIKAHQVIVTPGTPALSFNAADIPSDWFIREFEPATAPEIVKVVGTGKSVATVSTPIADTPINTADREVFVSSSYDLTESTVGINNGTLSGADAVDPLRHASRTERRQEQQPGGQAFKTGGTSTKVVTSDKYEYYYYQCLPGNADGVFPYRLFEKWTTISRAQGISDDTDVTTPEIFRIIAEVYTFSSDGLISKFSRETYAREKEFDPAGGLQWRLIEDFEETWTKQGESYRYDSVTLQAKITTDRAAAATNTANKWTRTVVDSDSRPASDNGDNYPPSPELWEGPYTITQSTYSGQATYTPPGGASSIASEDVIELPEGLGISNAVCASIAAKWAQIYGGKEYKMLLTFPITNSLIAIDNPLWQVAYTVDGRVRTYLVDNQAFNHTSDESLCSAVGILISDVAA